MLPHGLRTLVGCMLCLLGLRVVLVLGLQCQQLIGCVGVKEVPDTIGIRRQAYMGRVRAFKQSF